MNTDPVALLYTLILWAPPILLALSIHEFSHAWAAHRLGDPTAKQRGRLTLDPLKHVDPIGLVLLFLVHFGWAKPVPVDPRNFRRPRRDMALVALAGPASNLLSALLVTPFVRTGWLGRLPGPLAQLDTLVTLFFLISLVLAIFNLFPLPPLDGWNLLRLGLRDPDLEHRLIQLGPILLLVLIFVLPSLGLDLIGLWIRVPFGILSRILLGTDLSQLL